MRICCFDLETKLPAEGSDWATRAKAGELGISALVVADSESGRYHLYGEETLEEAIDHLNAADLLVSWNGIGFDAEVLFGCTGRYLMVPHYDMLAEVYKALGKRVKGYKLDQVARATLNMGKSGDGSFAAVLVASNKWATLFDYCCNDVSLVQHLFNHVVDTGWLCGADGERVDLERPPVEHFA